MQKVKIWIALNPHQPGCTFLVRLLEVVERLLFVLQASVNVGEFAGHGRHASDDLRGQGAARFHVGSRNRLTRGGECLSRAQQLSPELGNHRGPAKATKVPLAVDLQDQCSVTDKLPGGEGTTDGTHGEAAIAVNSPMSTGPIPVQVGSKIASIVNVPRLVWMGAGLAHDM